MIGISPGAGTALGGTAGSLLGQIGDAMSLPRRHLWNMLGAPLGVPEEATQSGASLLGYMGMDEESPWTQALGLGAEIAGDPLTYMGGLLGRAGGVASQLGRAGLTDDLARATATKGAASSALAEHALATEANLAAHTDRMRNAARMLDMDALQNTGAMLKPIARPNPGLADELLEGGLAQMDDAGMSLSGGMWPQYDYPKGGILTTANRAGGVRLPSVRAEAPPWGSLHTGGETLRPTGMGFVPSADEVNMLRREAASQMMANPSPLDKPLQASIGSIHNPGVSPNSVADAVAGRLAAKTAPPMPMISGQAADELFRNSEEDIAMLLARIGMMNTQAGYIDRAVTLGGAAGLGGAAYAVGMNAFGE